MNHKNKLNLILWICSVALIIATGLYFMPMEKDRPGFWESLYSILRLFVFERDLPTFPAAWPLIVIYFAAPLVTLSALGKLISYLFRLTPSLKTRRMSGHVIICGLGRLGRLIGEALKEKGVSAAAVDTMFSEEIEEWSHEHGIPVVSGDFQNHDVLARAGAGGARAIIFTTADDILNIDAAFTAYGKYRTSQGEVRLIWTHISDDSLADTLRSAVLTEGRLGIRFFDTYHIAARRMVKNCIDAGMMKKIDEIVIIGYGKFGSEVFEALGSEPGISGKVRFTIIDRRDISPHGVINARRLGLSRRVTCEKKDIGDVGLGDCKRAAVFLCTDNDLGNLSLALSLSDSGRAGCIFVRMGRWPMEAVSEHLGVDRGIIFVNINDLITRGLDGLDGIFSRAGEKDLKRIKNRG